MAGFEEASSEFGPRKGRSIASQGFKLLVLGREVFLVLRAVWRRRARTG